MGAQDQNLDVLYEAANAQLLLRLAHADSLDRVSGLLLAFSTAVAALTAPVQSRWLLAGRGLATVAAGLAIAALIVRAARDVDIRDVRLTMWADPTRDVMREIMDRRLQAGKIVADLAKWKAGLLFGSVALLSLSLIIIGLGTL